MPDDSRAANGGEDNMVTPSIGLLLLLVVCLGLTPAIFLCRVSPGRAALLGLRERGGLRGGGPVRRAIRVQRPETALSPVLRKVLHPFPSPPRVRGAGARGAARRGLCAARAVHRRTPEDHRTRLYAGRPGRGHTGCTHHADFRAGNPAADLEELHPVSAVPCIDRYRDPAADRLAYRRQRLVCEYRLEIAGMAGRSDDCLLGVFRGQIQATGIRYPADRAHASPGRTDQLPVGLHPVLPCRYPRPGPAE